MEKKFINVEDQDVSVYVLYMKNENTGIYACFDEAGNDKVTSSQLVSAFYTGMVLRSGDSDMVPQTLLRKGTTGTDDAASVLYYIRNSDGTVTSYNVKSVADPA